MPTKDIDKKPEEPVKVYTVMDRTAKDRPNTHDFFDEGRVLREYIFEPGKPRLVPRFVAMRCAEINKGQPDNPAFVVSAGEGLALDMDAFDEMSVEKILAEIELTLPQQAQSLRKKLDDFADTVKRQVETMQSNADKDAEAIVQLRGEVADAKAAASAGVPLGSCIAKYEDLVQPALLERAQARPGIEKLRSNPSKGEVVEFLIEGDKPTAPAAPAAETASLV